MQEVRVFRKVRGLRGHLDDSDVDFRRCMFDLKILTEHVGYAEDTVERKGREHTFLSKVAWVWRLALYYDQLY